MIPAIEARIAWTPNSDEFADWKTRGAVMVVPYPLTPMLGTRNNFYRGYEPPHWKPPYARYVDLCSASNDHDAVLRMLTTLIKIIAEDKMNPNTADLAFRVINEYRMMSGNEFGDWSSEHLVRFLQRRLQQAT